MRSRPEEYSDAKIRAALASYVRHGKFTLASDETGIPRETIRNWARSPHWADEMAALGHAHAKEVRREFAAGAADFAQSIAQAKLAADRRLLQIAADLDAEKPVNGKEIGAILRSLAASSLDVARLGDVVSDPAQGQGVSVPTRITLAMEVSPDAG